MSYHTPELLLVGSARSLVLGGSGKVPEINFDAAASPDSYEFEPSVNIDDSSW